MAHRLLCHLTLGLRGIKKKEKKNIVIPMRSTQRFNLE